MLKSLVSRLGSWIIDIKKSIEKAVRMAVKISSAVTRIEYELGLLKDLLSTLERIAYNNLSQTWENAVRWK